MFLSTITSFNGSVHSTSIPFVVGLLPATAAPVAHTMTAAWADHCSNQPTQISISIDVLGAK